MHVGIWQLPFNSKERRTNSVLLLQVFSKGMARAPRGRTGLEISDYWTALLAEAHVVMVNGLFTVMVPAGTLQPGSENKWSACLSLVVGLAQTSSSLLAI